MANLTVRPFGHKGVFMPLWDGLVPVMEMCPAWAYGVRCYCDLQSRDTVVMWEGPDGLTDAATEYDWCGYRWHEDGSCEELDAAEGMLWWCLDDLVWGALEESHLLQVDQETGHERTVEEVKDLMRLRGVVYAGDASWSEPDVSAEDWEKVREALTPSWEREGEPM